MTSIYKRTKEAISYLRKTHAASGGEEGGGKKRKGRKIGTRRFSDWEEGEGKNSLYYCARGKRKGGKKRETRNRLKRGSQIKKEKRGGNRLVPSSDALHTLGNAR